MPPQRTASATGSWSTPPGKTLGRLATQIADTLRGKRKPEYTPHCDVGDFVIVVNAEKIAVTGKKREEKLYHRHSGYPGGLRTRTLNDMLERQPEEVIRKAVKGMLPRNRLAAPAAAQAQGLRRAPTTPTLPSSPSRWRSRMSSTDERDEPQDEQAPEEARGGHAPTPRRMPRPTSLSRGGAGSLRGGRARRRGAPAEEPAAEEPAAERGARRRGAPGRGAR